MSRIVPTRFELGRCVTTRGVADGVPDERILECIKLHASGDWGVLHKEDMKANDDALKNGERILSCYPIDPAKPAKGDNRIWIITEWDRSVTTVLFPDEY